MFSVEKNRQAYFFSMNIKIVDLLMQIEGTKLPLRNFLFTFSLAIPGSELEN